MWVDVAAPGRGVHTTTYDPATGQHSYDISWSTTPSTAAPHVAGLAGLLFSRLGTNTPRDRILATIKYSTDDITGANDPTADYWGSMGTGRIDSRQALNMADSTMVAQPGQSITAAINAAPSGYRVYVRPGTYSENVTMRSGVKLIASRSDSTTITSSSNATVTFNNVTNTEISGFTITGYVGVDVYNGSSNITIRNCRIQGSYQGIWANYANPTVRNCEILTNTYGIWLSTSAGTGVIAQNNRIEGNGRGLFLDSTPTLQNRHNSIKNNTYADLQASSGSDFIWAQRNWWGENPPTPSQIITVRGIDYTNYLTSDPIPSTHTPPKLVVRAGSSPYSPGNGDEADLLARRGRELFEGGQLEAGIDVYRQVVEQFPDASIALVALKELVGTYHQLEAWATAERYLQEIISRTPASSLGQTARRLQFDLLILQKKHPDALVLAKQLQQDLTDIDIAEEVTFQAAFAALLGLGRQQEGEAALRTYLAQYPAEDGNTARQMHRQLAHAFLGEPPEAEVATKVSSVAAVNLEPATPNPFNPQTAIVFELPAATEVTLQVYNTLGQVVRTLVDRATMSAGRQRMVWDGQDEHGRALASGVYLARLEVGEQVVTRKLTLLR